MPEQPDVKKQGAIDAMLRADGRPPLNPNAPGMLARQASAAPIGPQTGQIRGVEEPRTFISMLEEMRDRDIKYYTELIDWLQEFVGQKRADLQRFERLIGTGERSGNTKQSSS